MALTSSMKWQGWSGGGQVAGASWQRSFFVRNSHEIGIGGV